MQMSSKVMRRLPKEVKIAELVHYMMQFTYKCLFQQNVQYLAETWIVQFIFVSKDPTCDYAFKCKAKTRCALIPIRPSSNRNGFCQQIVKRVSLTPCLYWTRAVRYGKRQSVMLSTLNPDSKLMPRSVDDALLQALAILLIGWTNRLATVAPV